MKTKAADKRAAILRAAFEVVTHRGYVETKVDDVARHAGVAKGTVYLYFKDKPDIYIGLMDWLLEQALGVIRDTAARHLPARERLAAIFEVWSNSVFSRPAVIDLLSMENINQTEKIVKRIRKQVMPHMQEMIDEIARIIESGVEQGEFRKVDSRIAALTYLNAFRAAIFAVGNKWPVKAPGSTVMELFFRGVLAEHGREPDITNTTKEYVVRKLLICLVPALLLGRVALADTLRLDAQKSVELALENNRQIAQAQTKLDEAAAGKGTAFGAFLPQVSATGTYTRLGKVSEFVMASPIPGKFQYKVKDPAGNIIGLTDSIPVLAGYRFDTLQLGSANNFALTGTVQQTLFTWGKLINAYRIAGLSYDLQKEAAAQARAQVRVDATQSFYQALLARKTVDVMNDALRQLKGHVGQVQSLYDNGMATKLDLMKATLGLQQMEAQVSQIENGAELATAVLLNTLGLDPGTVVAFDEELAPDSTTAEPDQATKQALERRPELAQLRYAAKMADLGVLIARTSNLPNAFVQANGSYKNPVGFTAGWGPDWSATAGLSMPIFAGLSNLNKLKAAQARSRQARVALAIVEDGVKLEVKALALGLNQEAKNAAYQKKNVEVADAALGLAQARYENGLLTNLDYMDSQLALTQARVAYLNALANYRVARAKLQKAVGEF